MSSFAYGALTRKREEAAADTSTDENPPGVKTYVDALAALVPAEVIAVHSIVISYAVAMEDGSSTIRAPEQLAFYLWFLLVLAPAFFLGGLQRVPAGWDYVRLLIPAVAFVAWTLLQPMTAFDGVAPGFSPDWRWALGLAVASVIGLVAGALGMVADRQPEKPARRRIGARQPPH